MSRAVAGSPPTCTPSTLEPGREAHLPAEQSPSREDTRLPAAHAHPRRPGNHRRPPSQGPCPLVRLSAVRLAAQDRRSTHAAARASAAAFSGLPWHGSPRCPRRPSASSPSTLCRRSDESGPTRAGFRRGSGRRRCSRAQHRAAPAAPPHALTGSTGCRRAHGSWSGHRPGRGCPRRALWPATSTPRSTGLLPESPDAAASW